MPHCVGGLFAGSAGVFNFTGRIAGLSGEGFTQATFINAVEYQKIVVQDSSEFGYACITTLPAKGQTGMTAIVPDQFVSYARYRAAPSSWIGTWVDGPNKIVISKRGKSLSFAGAGHYLPQHHWGFFGFDAVPRHDFASNIPGISGDDLHYASQQIELDSSECAVGIKKVYGLIFVESSLVCGGLNVAFEGEYHRIKP